MNVNLQLQHSYLYQIALQCFHFKLLEKPKHGKINVICLIVLINGILFIWKILTSDPFLPLHLHDWDQYRRKLSPPGNKEWLYKLWKKKPLSFNPKIYKSKTLVNEKETALFHQIVEKTFHWWNLLKQCGFNSALQT